MAVPKRKRESRAHNPGDDGDLPEAWPPSKHKRKRGRRGSGSGASEAKAAEAEGKAVFRRQMRLLSSEAAKNLIPEDKIEEFAFQQGWNRGYCNWASAPWNAGRLRRVKERLRTPCRFWLNGCCVMAKRCGFMTPFSMGP